MWSLLPTIITLCALTCAESATSSPEVTTQSGGVRGAVLKSLTGRSFYSFKGIPYAEPPVGELRFRSPQPHRGWKETRDAKRHGSTCLQFSPFVPGALQGAEDCLFLNVYTPALPEATAEHLQLPVMVWIHGGGFVTGSGDADFYGPDYLMDEQVVLVTINYRLGAFGFFTTGDAAAPGNYGLHDQVLALEWVQANIDAFGGDPGVVTIFGESAGGASVGLQVLSPRARGLFARAISQSGAAFCSFAASGEPQGQNAQRHAELLGCSTTSSREVVGCMRHLPAAEVVKATAEVLKENTRALPGALYKPRVDADSQMPFLPVDPHVALKAGTFNRVPWMNGMNQAEGAFFVFLLGNYPEGMAVCRSRDWSRWAASVLEIDTVTSDPGAVAEAIHRHYFGAGDCGDDTLAAFSDLYTDRLFTNCILSETSLAAAHTPVYAYVLDHTGPGRQSLPQALAAIFGRADAHTDLGVAHADDVLYLFKAVFGAPVKPGSDAHKMIRLMVSLWVNFARRGYPSTDVVSMPSWPIYTASWQEHMRLNMEPSVGKEAFSERRQFWQQLDISESWRLPMVTAQRDEL